MTKLRIPLVLGPNIARTIREMTAVLRPREVSNTKDKPHE